MRNSTLIAGLVFAALASGFLAAGGSLLTPAALAQNIGQRVVNGSVVDSDSTAIPGATVFLKELKNKSIRSFTSDAKGRFRFTQVNMAEDHELWAEKAGRKTPVKTVSQWDARKDYETELKMK